MRVLSLLLVILSFPVGADRLKDSDFRGKWVLSNPDTRLRVAELFSADRAMQLTFRAQNEVTLTRQLEDGTSELLVSQSFEQIGELYHWSFESEFGKFQLILGGWGVQRKTLFGYLYLTNQEVGVYNGWPVAMEPANDS